MTLLYLGVILPLRGDGTKQLKLHISTPTLKATSEENVIFEQKMQVLRTYLLGQGYFANTIMKRKYLEHANF